MRSKFEINMHPVMSLTSYNMSWFLKFRVTLVFCVYNFEGQTSEEENSVAFMDKRKIRT